jgi:hypothetical protein
MPSAKPTFEAMFDGFLADPFFGPVAKTITFTVVSGGTIDPVTGVVTDGGSTVYTADGFSRSPREKEFRDILGGDMVFTVKQIDLAYTPVFDDDAVLTGGEGTTFNGTYRVVELISDGADVTYRIQLRR